MNLEIDSVELARGGQPVLEGVSASLDAGSLVGLVGPNGAGKTTLLQTVNGLLEPDSGRVRLDGQDVSELSSRTTSQRVATVPQESSLSFEFSVRGVVEMGRHPHVPRIGRDPDAQLVERALEQTETAHLADRSIGDVSGGERQRVLLARAIAQDTPLMLLDEPTASLDIAHQVKTMEQLRTHVDCSSKSALAAIHDLELAARYCDRLLVLSNGEILDSGAPESVLTPTILRDAFDANATLHVDPVTDTPRITALAREAGVQSEHADGTADSAEDTDSHSERQRLSRSSPTTR